MWPIKNYIKFKSVFKSSGEREFEFNFLPQTPEHALVSFVINVFARSHSLIHQSQLRYHTDFIDLILVKNEIFGFDEMIIQLLKQEEDAFIKYADKMNKSKEIYIYSLKGLFITNTYLHHEIPHMAKPTNWYFLFARLLFYFDKNVSIESKKLLIIIFKHLRNDISFIERKYSVLNYFEIPNRIIQSEIQC